MNKGEKKMSWTSDYNNRVPFDILRGKTLTSVEVNGDEIIFKTTDGLTFIQKHLQDCCESVYVEDLVGEIQDILNEPILLAEESCSCGEGKYGNTYTWTFYKLATNHGYLTIRWYGSSNGYYSESVDLIQQGKKE